MTELLILRVLHVLGGIFWVGSMLFNTFYLAPALGAAGPAASQVGMNLQKRGAFTALPIAAIVTMLAGARLMMIGARMAPGGAYFASPVGKTYSIGGALAVIAFLFGLIVVRPAMMRSAAIAGTMTSDGATRDRIQAELRALQSRGRWSSLVVAILLIGAALCMSIARYV
ncbi:MAG TPA: hypothetical protein VJ867_16930 [Gemmatimonadaceae bacterium]|nr:hypothetical protein [Gemmatimonadaceae bacterium]